MRRPCRAASPTQPAMPRSASFPAKSGRPRALPAACRRVAERETGQHIDRFLWYPLKSANNQKKDPASLLEKPGHNPGNNLLSRDLTSYYHQLLGA